MPARLGDEVGDVLGQQVAIGHERDGGHRDAAQVVLAAGVALGDRSARVAGAGAVGDVESLDGDEARALEVDAVDPPRAILVDGDGRLWQPWRCYAEQVCR